MNNPNRPNPDPVSQAVQDNGNAKLVGAKELLKEKLLAAVLQQAINELGAPDSIAGHIMGVKGSEIGSIVAASHILKELITSEIELRSRQKFTDTVGVAKELFESVSNDGEVVDAIANEVRAMILASASRNAESSVENPAQVASELLSSDLVDNTLIDRIKDSLRAKMLEAATSSSTESLADVDSAAREVLNGFGENPQIIANLSDRVREFALEEVERRAKTSIADQDSAAGEVWNRIGSDHEAIQSVVDAVQERMIADIANRSQQTLTNVESTAESARQLIGSDPAGVVKASKRLEEMLVHEIVHAAERAMADTQSAVRMALNEVRPAKDDLARIQEGLKSKILSDVLSRAIKEINEEVSATAADIWLRAADSDIADGPNPDRPSAPLPGELDPTDHEAPVVESDTDSWYHSDAGTEESHLAEDATSQAVVTESVDNDDDETGWYSIEGVENRQADEPSDDNAAAGEEPGFAMPGILDTVIEDAKPKDALRALANWRRKPKSWEVDEVNFGTTESAEVESTDNPEIQSIDNSDLQPEEGASATDLSGMESWSVAILRDSHRLTTKVRESDQMIEDSLGQISKGVVTFVKEEMHRLDGLNGGEAAELMCAHCVQRTHTAISDVTVESRRKDMEGMPEEADELIFSASYLIAAGTGYLIEDEIARLTSEFEELGFTFTLDGPLSPDEFAKGGPSSSVTQTTY